MNYIARAVKEELLIRRGNLWVTPFGTYKRLGNAVRFLRPHFPLLRKFDFETKLIGMSVGSKPFLLYLRIGKK